MQMGRRDMDSRNGPKIINGEGKKDIYTRKFIILSHLIYFDAVKTKLDMLNPESLKRAYS
jgi:hypothetical protein